MDTSRGRPPADEDDANAEQTETMTGVGVPAGDGTLEGLGYDGEEPSPGPDLEHESGPPESEGRDTFTS
jgi:hypothetical protein